MSCGELLRRAVPYGMSKASADHECTVLLTQVLEGAKPCSHNQRQLWRCLTPWCMVAFHHVWRKTILPEQSHEI